MTAQTGQLMQLMLIHSGHGGLFAMAARACTDTPQWVGVWGMTCDGYANGEASMWSGTQLPHLCMDRGQRVERDFIGAKWKYPEENCCACGDGIEIRCVWIFRDHL